MNGNDEKVLKQYATLANRTTRSITILQYLVSDLNGKINCVFQKVSLDQHVR